MTIASAIGAAKGALEAVKGVADLAKTMKDIKGSQSAALGAIPMMGFKPPLAKHMKYYQTRKYTRQGVAQHAVYCDIGSNLLRFLGLGHLPRMAITVSANVDFIEYSMKSDKSSKRVFVAGGNIVVRPQPTGYTPMSDWFFTVKTSMNACKITAYPGRFPDGRADVLIDLPGAHTDVIFTVRIEKGTVVVKKSK